MRGVQINTQGPGVHDDDTNIATSLKSVGLIVEQRTDYVSQALGVKVALVVLKCGILRVAENAIDDLGLLINEQLTSFVAQALRNVSKIHLAHINNGLAPTHLARKA